MLKQLHRFVLTLLATGMLAAPACASEWQYENASRIVAIADVHGAYGAMVETLRQASVIGSDSQWIAGQAHLVIVGDILDRGPDSREAMDLLMRLEDEAADAGGRVHVLIGNHEAMNLIGDLRYVAKEEFAAFADDEKAIERDRWFDAFVKKRATVNGSAEELRTAFDRSFPAGFFAHRRAFASDGKYGRWLLSKPIMVVINDTAFVHGGLPATIAEIGLEGVNGKLHGDLESYVLQLEYLVDAGVLLPTDSFHSQPGLLRNYMPALTDDVAVIEAIDAAKELNESPIFSKNGPTWYRGNVSCGHLIEGDRLDDALQAIGAQRVVIGHTPTPNRQVLERFDGRVIEIDTGMLSGYYKGSGNALVISDERVAAVNQTSDELIEPQAHPRRVGMRPGGFLVADALEQLLAKGAVIKVAEDETGRTLVTVSDGERTVDSVFSKRARRGFYPEVAAYRLDRMLQLDMVPVTVKREVDGVEGSLQFLPESSFDEVKRQQDNTGGTAQCALPDQWEAMFVFDALTFNPGRSFQAILYSPDDWQMMLVRHDRAFVAQKGRPPHLKTVALRVNQAWKDTLASLDDERLAESLGDVLDKRRLKALGARRDELLSL